MKIFILLFLSFSLFCADRPAQSRTVTVALTSADVSQFGGWTIPRRWYGTLIQRANDGGASRIFVDIAFVTADALHPESDEYFYDVITASPNIFLLTAGVTEQNGSVTLLGNRTFPADRTFLPFSRGIQFYGERPMLVDSTVLTSQLLAAGSRHFLNTIVDFPKEYLRADHSFSEALTKDIDWKGNDVIITVENPGVTSYIVSPSGVRQSTTMLQIWMAEQLTEGNFIRLLASWQYVVIGLLCTFPILWFGFKRRVTAGIATSTISWSLSLIVLSLIRIVIPDWYSSMVIAWILLSIGMIAMILFARRPANDNGMIPERDGSETNDEVESLRYQLKYYEQLSQQFPPDGTVKRSETADIIYHQRSPLNDILKKAGQIAESSLPVLISGESGTGKEKLALYIHQRSSRKDQPFIAVNCSSLNDGLIESELFGHEQGSFTGANRTKIGRFELANGGTLFLDEIGETTPSFQTKVLRVLQENIFERVGGTTGIRIDVRIIAATNRNLKEMSVKGTFREDLFYRLHGFELELPPLRERKEDIEVLFKHFLYTQDPSLSYSPQLIEWLKEQRWPGNIRQLQSATQRAVLNARMHDRTFIIPKDLELGTTGGNESADDSDVIAQKVLDGLRKYRFDHRSIAKVSADLGLHRSTVTEYFRGWVIRFLMKHRQDRTAVLTSLLGGVVPEDREKFEERVNGYISAVHASCAEGKQAGSTPEEIVAAQFRKLPIPFRSDALQLISAGTAWMK
ncbi:MAG: sigma 54-interacting transcriptional regulator [Bacteroidota bacterium]